MLMHLCIRCLDVSHFWVNIWPKIHAYMYVITYIRVYALTQTQAKCLLYTHVYTCVHMHVHESNSSVVILSARMYRSSHMCTHVTCFEWQCPCMISLVLLKINNQNKPWSLKKKILAPRLLTCAVCCFSEGRTSFLSFRSFWN